MNQWPPASQPAVSMLILPGVLPPFVRPGHLSRSLTTFLLVICHPATSTADPPDNNPGRDGAAVDDASLLAAFAALAPPLLLLGSSERTEEGGGVQRAAWRLAAECTFERGDLHRDTTPPFSPPPPDKNTPNRLRRAFTEIRQ